jgi:uncharacterized protein
MVGELTQKETKDFFSQKNFGHLGCNDGSRMYIVPISYIYFEDHILCHSHAGMKIDIMRKNPSVCFEVDEVKDYTHWKSLIAWGKYEEITDEKEIENAERQFANRSLNIKFSFSSRPTAEISDDHRIERPAMSELIFYKIKFTEITSRYESGGFTFKIV